MRSKSAYNGKEKDKEMDSAGHALAGERCRRNGIGIGIGMGMGMVERCTGATGSYYFEKLSPFISVHDLSILILHDISLSSTYTLLFSFLSSDSALEIIAAGRL